MAQETRVAYGEKLAELVQKDPNIVVLDADLSKSTKTYEAKKVAPERHFNAGIAECNMMGMAAGLAASGKTVFASSFAMFAVARPYEIIRNSICYPKLNVKICATHAGLSVGEDGASHQAIEDISLMRTLPNMRVYVPCDYYQTKAVIDHVYKVDGPCYVRMGRGKVDDFYNENTKFNLDKIDILNKGEDVVLIATGLMVQEAMAALPKLQALGINPTVVNVCSIKPIDVDGIKELLTTHKKAYTLEEHLVTGGLYSAVAEVKAELEHSCVVHPIGITDMFGESGPGMVVLEEYGLRSDSIVKLITE